jgi:uncharacterized protein YjbJ (UPF0337 family)
MKNKDEIKGEMKDIKGRVRRQAGEWTDRTDQQMKGAAEQAQGKGQKMVGRAKDVGKDIGHDLGQMGRNVGQDVRDMRRNAMDKARGKTERTDEDVRSENREKKDKAA